ncbi:MAG: MFS transporter [Chloroflexi bacterium]|nr:MFS transporter [Chloroflexota bacterium]
MTDQPASREAQALLARFDGARLGAFHYKLLLVTGGTWIWASFGVGIIGFILPGIQAQWQINPTQEGLAASFGLAGMMVGAVLAGILADRIGRKQTLEIIMVCVGLFMGISALSWSFPVFLALRLVSGMALGAVLPVGSTLVSEYSPAKYRGRLLVLLNTCFALGGVLAAIVGYFLVPAYGWRAALGFGILGLTSLPLVRLFLPESLRFLVDKGRLDQAIRTGEAIEANGNGQRNDKPGPEAHPQKNRPMIHGAKNDQPWSPVFLGRTLGLWFVWFALNFVFQGVFVWLPSILVAGGYAISASFLLALVINIGQVPGNLAAAALADAASRRWTLIASLALLGVTTFFYGFARSQAGILAWGILLAVFTGMGWALAYPFTTELYPTHMRGTATGWATGFGRVGGILAPLVVGLFIQIKVGNPGIFTMLAVVPLLATLIIFRLKHETTGRTLEEIT